MATGVSMTDRPILFSGPMVRALLDGRKTQTRRVLRVPTPFDTSDDISAEIATGFIELQFRRGDRLWVREAHSLVPASAYRGSVGTGTIAQTEHPTDGYSAAVFREGFDRSGEPRWRPSIHMPRWASRLTLSLSNVRVQRLQDIGEEDAQAEGIERMKTGRGYYDPTVSKAMVRAGVWHRKASQGFEALWDSLNAHRAPWVSNPWVVALTFTVQRGNIDQVGLTDRQLRDQITGQRA